MRTVNSAQLAGIAADHQLVDARFRVLRGSEWIDLTQWLGENWLVSYEVTQEEEQPAATATVVLRRETATGSLAPRMSSNPELRIGRLCELTAAVVPSGTAFVSSDRVGLFRGFVEDIAWGGDTSEVSLNCVDYVSQLLDTTIDEPRTYGTLPDEDEEGFPISIAATIRDIYNEFRPAGMPPLVLQSLPYRATAAFELEPTSLYNAMQDLANQAGWEIRQRYVGGSSAGGWAIVVSVPQAITGDQTPALTFNASQYFDLEGLEVSTLGIVDRIVYRWTFDTGLVRRITSPDGTVETSYILQDREITAQLPQPVSERGYRSRVIDDRGNPQVATIAQAEAKANAIIAGIGRDGSGASVVGPLDWRPELGDWIRYSANNVHHSGNYEGAVVGVRHSFSEGAVSTTLTLRGSYAGGVRRWSRIIGETDRDREINAPEDPVNPQDGVFWYLTTAEGEQGFTRSSTPETSQGGYLSITPVNQSRDGLFGPIDFSVEAQSVIRSVALLNVSGCPIDPARAIFDLGTFPNLDDENDGMGVTWQMAWDLQGARPFRQPGAISQVFRGGSWVNIFTSAPDAPADAPNFQTPLTAAAALSIGLIPPLYAAVIHIRLQVQTTAIDRITRDSVRVGQCASVLFS